MPQRIEDEDNQLPVRDQPRQLFAERYPEFVSWLDGTTWELDPDTDLAGDTLNGFRSNLFYQARSLGLNLTTKTVHRPGPDGQPHRYLRVRAF